MTSSTSLRVTCDTCGMTFTTHTLLKKHKERFCVGQAVEDDEDHWHESPSPAVPYNPSYSRMIDELEKLKRRKARENVRQQNVKLEPRKERYSPTSHDEEYSVSSVSSMSINIPDDEDMLASQSHRDITESSHLQYGNILSDLNEQRQRLLWQKQEINNQLEALKLSGVSPSSADVMRQLQQQEANNKLLLDNLRSQFSHLHKKQEDLEREVVIRPELESQAAVVKNINHINDIFDDIKQRLLQQAEDTADHQALNKSASAISNKLAKIKHSHVSGSNAATSVEKSESLSKADCLAMSHGTQQQPQNTLHRNNDRNLQHVTSRSGQDDGSAIARSSVSSQSGFTQTSSVQSSTNSAHCSQNSGPDDSVLQDIHNLRQLYLRQGGNNRDILAQLAAMEREAMGLQGQTRKKPDRNNHKYHCLDEFGSLSDQLNNVELENQKLQRELAQLQDRNTSRLAFYHNLNMEKGRSYERQLLRRQEENERRLHALQQELDAVLHQVNYQRIIPYMPYQVNQPPIVPRAYEAPVLPVAAAAPITDDELLPAPYDPVGGFMVFYDFVSGLLPSVMGCCLLVSLHKTGSSLGQPQALPSVTATSDPQGHPRNIAVLAQRQPVPNCAASSDLSLVIQLQVTMGHTSKMHIVAWSKMELFDQHNRLQSGRWRLPLRTTPINTDTNYDTLNTIPQYGEAELYLRLVNQRNARSQTMVNIDPQHDYLYKYPPQSQVENKESRSGHQKQVAADVSPTDNCHSQECESMPQSQRSVNASLASFSSISLSITDLPQQPHPSSLASQSTQILEVNSKPLALPLTKTPSPQSSLQRQPASMQVIPPVPPPPTASSRAQASRQSPRAEGMAAQVLGFQVDKVKHAEPGEAKVRLTAYYKHSAKVAQSGSGAITCSSGSVLPTFRHNCHVFGLQEARFENVSAATDMVLVVRLYMVTRASSNHIAEETLVAWAALPLTLPDREYGRRFNTGSRSLALYEPPVASVSLITAEGSKARRDWKPYRDKATIKLYIYINEPRPGSLTSSLPSDDEDTALPPSAWIQSDRHQPPTEPYLSSQGFDLYIDSCRFLPDVATFTKVSGRILSRSYKKFGKDINAVTVLDTDVFNPVYKFRAEFREPHIPPTATLLLKVYTLDKFYTQLTVVGHATLNIFVETGTEKQPTTDVPGTQVSLNEGGHQLRLYHKGPTGTDPLTANILAESGVRIVPCASVLVRIVKAPIGPMGKSLQASKVAQKDWERLGLWLPMPQYEFGGYYTTRCQPTVSEEHLYAMVAQRRHTNVRDVVTSISSKKDLKALRSDEAMENYIKTQLAKLMDSTPVDLDLIYISKYNPKSGLKVAIDAAFNLPWSGFTFGIVSFNPPAAFYQGPPHGTYDKPHFLQMLDMFSSNKAPLWKDGYKSFPNRGYHKHLCIIVHLQEIQVSIEKNNYVYKLMDQAWSAVQVFNEGYAECNYFQLPLISGAPSMVHLEQLTQEPCRNWLQRNLANGNIQSADNASVLVRLSDGRRDSELPVFSSKTKMEDVNTEYLKLVPRVNYGIQQDGHPLTDSIPQAKNPNTFSSHLALKFKTLVYQVYEEGKMG